MINNVVEVWKPIEGFEELYSVSNFGQVRSNDRKVWNGRAYYSKKGRVLKKSKTTTGYWKVELYKDGNKKSKKVHRLVAKAFIPRVKGKNLINHKDGNPLNNEVSNLEWCNQSENMRHAYDTGLIKGNFLKHEKEIVKEYLENKDINVNELARKYRCSHTTVRRYLKNNGVKIRGLSHVKDVYKIDRRKMVHYFKKGKSNKEIAKTFGVNNGLIATYRYKHKKGELIV